MVGLAEHVGVLQLSLSHGRLPTRRTRDGAEDEPMPSEAADSGPFFHGTKSHLQPGDLLEPGYGSNFGKRMRANYIYLTATLDAATWGAELAVGDGPGRIYRVEPTGPFEDDPNLTDKRFPGNPTKSYRTREPLLGRMWLLAGQRRRRDPVSRGRTQPPFSRPR